MTIGDLALALVCYVPLLLTDPGKLGADTKVYLYLDPGKLLSKSLYMWDPAVGLGTVTHQNIGYLFPMGPYYWFMELLNVPDWIAQRIWLGSVMFLGGLGVRYFLRTLKWEGPGVTVACFAYALSPYLLHYFYKHSVILLPFTALPWLVAFTARSLRHPGWKYPAWFALVALASGGINATSLVLVMIGPILWVLHAVFVEREVTIRQAWGPIRRIAILGIATSVWWVMGLLVQGEFGIDVLRFTETYQTVSNASSATEVGRGLGYWFFYGTDTFGPWFISADTMLRNIAALAISFAVPIVCIACALWTRFRYRVFFIGIAVVGTIVSVGAHPFDEPSLYGSVFKSFASSGPGLALRSTPRAIPLVALAFAVFLGAGVAAAAKARPDRRLGYASAAIVLVMANLSPLFTGDMIDPYLEFPNDVPEYWRDAANHIDGGDHRTRVLEIPGIEFANYRWGSTVDPITPGLIDRSYAARELVPYGSEASADLMNAIDLPLQDRSFDPDSLAPILRLLGVGDLVARNDLEYERYRTPRPRIMQRWLDQAVGLGEPRTFGTNAPNVASARSPLLDDLELSIPDDDPDPFSVSVHPVEDPLPVVRTAPAARPQIISGDGAGLVSAAEAGLLDPERLVVYSGTVSADERRLERLVDAGAELVVTDSNRKAGRRWGTTKDNDGYTEMADETVAEDPTDNRLDLFGGRGTDVQTVVEQRGGLRAVASGYGNALSFTPGDRAYHAVDDDPDTAWKVGAFADVTGEWIEVSSESPEAHRTLTLRQAHRQVNRFITRARLTFDGAESIEVTLDDSSRHTGQRIDLGDRTFSTLRITVLETSTGIRADYAGVSGVGFAELRLGEMAPTTEVVRPPVDLLNALGRRSDDLPLSFVFRRRIAPADSGALDEEKRLLRSMSLVGDRSFSMSGKVRIDAAVGDSAVDGLLGVGGAAMTASSGLTGTARTRASKAFDDDAATAWKSRIAPEAGEWVQLAGDRPITVRVDSISVLADGRHSVPTRIHFEVDGVPGASIALPDVEDAERGTVRDLDFEPVELSGTTFRLVVDEFRAVDAPNWLSAAPTTLPISVASVGDDAFAEAISAVDPVLAACRSDLLTVDGAAVGIRIDAFADALAAGDASALADAVDRAERGELLNYSTCDAAEVPLEAGERLIESTSGTTTGISIDQLLLSSRPVGETETAATSDASGADESDEDGPGRSQTEPGPRLRVQNKAADSIVASLVDSHDEPYWLILGQSHNDGWQLTVGGETLPRSELVNGFANGWYIDPAVVGDSPRFELSWTGQGRVWIALLVSLVGFLVCLVLALRPALESTHQEQGLNPVLISLLDAYGRPAGWGQTAALGLGALLAGLVFVGDWWGVIAGVAMVAALRTAWGWRLLRFGTVAILGLCAAYVVAKQWRNDYPVNFDWTGHFSVTHWPIMLAYVLIGCECVVEVIRGGWRRDALASPRRSRRRR